MPSAPTSGTLSMLEPYLAAVGVPPSLTSLFWQAIDAAGLTVVTKAAGTPVETIDASPSERVAALGMPGVYLCGVKVGERGWFAWLERTGPAGELVRGEPVFVSGGGGDFLRRPQTTGRWTVGDSLVGGTDQIT